MTTTKNYPNLFADAEQSTLPGVLASHAEALAALKLDPQTSLELDIAEDRVNAITTSWRRLADEFTPADYAEALAALEMATQRRTGAKAFRERAERNIRSSDTTLAKVCEPILEKAYPGATVITTFADVPGFPKASEFPVVVVQQKQKTTISRDGYVSGEVIVHYLRQDTHKELDASRIQDAADALHVSLETIGHPRNERPAVGDKVHESLRVQVHQAAIDAPYLPTVESHNLHRLPTAVAGAIAAEVNYHGHVVEAHLRSLSYASSLVVTMASDHELISEVVDDGGLRTLVVESSVIVYVKSNSGPALELAERVEKIGGHFNSRVMVGSLGMVDKFEFLTNSAPADQAEAKRRHLELVQKIKGSPGTDFKVDTGAEEFLTVWEYPFRATLVSSTRRPHVEAAA